MKPFLFWDWFCIEALILPIRVMFEWLYYDYEIYRH